MFLCGIWLGRGRIYGEPLRVKTQNRRGFILLWVWQNVLVRRLFCISLVREKVKSTLNSHLGVCMYIHIRTSSKSLYNLIIRWDHQRRTRSSYHRVLFSFNALVVSTPVSIRSAKNGFFNSIALRRARFSLINNCYYCRPVEVGTAVITLIIIGIQRMKCGCVKDTLTEIRVWKWLPWTTSNCVEYSNVDSYITRYCRN